MACAVYPVIAATLLCVIGFLIHMMSVDVLSRHANDKITCDKTSVEHISMYRPPTVSCSCSCILLCIIRFFYLQNSETVDSVRHSTRAVNSRKNLNRTEMPLKGRRTTSKPPPSHFVDHIRREIERPKSTSRDQSSSLKITRYYKLYNRCSHRHLRIAGRHVDAAAMLNDRFSEYIIYIVI